MIDEFIDDFELSKVFKSLREKTIDEVLKEGESIKDKKPPEGYFVSVVPLRVDKNMYKAIRFVRGYRSKSYVIRMAVKHGLAILDHDLRLTGVSAAFKVYRTLFDMVDKFDFTILDRIDKTTTSMRYNVNVGVKYTEMVAFKPIWWTVSAVDDIAIGYDMKPSDVYRMCITASFGTRYEYFKERYNEFVKEFAVGYRDTMFDHINYMLAHCGKAGMFDDKKYVENLQELAESIQEVDKTLYELLVRWIK